MERKSKHNYPLWLSLIVYWIATFVLLFLSILETNGHFGYPLDDTYIHMAIGKHFANEGVWSVSQNGFSSSTSSPLWTFLIAMIYKVLGINDWIPFILCLIVGSFLIWYIAYLLRDTPNSLRSFLFILIVVFFTPLPILTLTGMEHVLQSFLILGLIYRAAKLLSLTRFDFRQLSSVLLLAGATTLTRYEGLFLIVSIALLFFIKKIYRAALLTLGAGWLPITIYGIFSMFHGWYFFPNSVLLKGNLPVLSVAGLARFLQQLPSSLIATPHFFALLIGCLAAYLWCKSQGASLDEKKYTIALFLMVILLHMQFASTGWLYRYDAYLVLVGCVILLDTLNTISSSQQAESADKMIVSDDIELRGIVILTALLLNIPFAVRAAHAIKDYPLAVMNIYEQQYQMGTFIKKFYDGRVVAANDIGAINYLANIKTLDLFGLGSIEVAQSKRMGRYDMQIINELTSQYGVEMIMIYKIWFPRQIPENWIEIGEWQITNNVACGYDRVSFYVQSSSHQEEAIANLREFSNLLPTTVIQSGLYTEP